MTTYKYVDGSQNRVAHIIDDDGVSRGSCLVTTLPVGTQIADADDGIRDAKAPLPQGPIPMSATEILAALERATAAKEAQQSRIAKLFITTEGATTWYPVNRNN